MARMTITEGLAELKTIGKRMEKKQRSVLEYLTRPDVIRDPMEKEGGSEVYVRGELQSLEDLRTRYINIRTAIQRVNDTTDLTVSGVTRTISQWLTWKREVAPNEGGMLEAMRNRITTERGAARRNAITQPAQQRTDQLVVNVNEKELAEKIEKYEAVMGTLDGALSLKNATTFIEVAD